MVKNPVQTQQNNGPKGGYIMWQYNNVNSLSHTGVMGMKWGRRKASGGSTSGSTRKAGSATKVKTVGYDKSKTARDVRNYGAKGQRRIEAAANAGKSKAITRGKELIKIQLKALGVMAVTTDVMTGGELHREAGKAIAKAYFKSKIARNTAKAVVKIAQKKKFNPIDTVYTILN